MESTLPHDQNFAHSSDASAPKASESAVNAGMQDPPADPQTSGSVAYATFGQRFLAYWVDYAILFLIISGILVLLGMSPLKSFSAQTVEEAMKLSSQYAGPSVLISFLVGLVYNVYFWVNRQGATPGKKLLGIQIVKENGSKFGYPGAVGRTLAGALSYLTLLVLFGIGYLMIGWTKKKQALHDMISGTLVVRTGKQSHTLVALLIVLATMLALAFYILSSFLLGMRLGLQEAKKNGALPKTSVNQQTSVSVTNSMQMENAQQETAPQMPEQADTLSARIGSYAPTNCGVSLPIPKTTDTYAGKNRAWMYEEAVVTPDTFYILNEDVLPQLNNQVAFLQYTDVNFRVSTTSLRKVGFPGVQLFCADNVKNLSLAEYFALTLTNTKYQVDPNYQMVAVNDMRLLKVSFRQKDKSGKGTGVTYNALIGLSKNGKKLLLLNLINASSMAAKDPMRDEVQQDVTAILDRMRYRDN